MVLSRKRNIQINQAKIEIYFAEHSYVQENLCVDLSTLHRPNLRYLYRSLKQHAVKCC